MQSNWDRSRKTQRHRYFLCERNDYLTQDMYLLFFIVGCIPFNYSSQEFLSKTCLFNTMVRRGPQPVTAVSERAIPATTSGICSSLKALLHDLSKLPLFSSDMILTYGFKQSKVYRNSRPNAWKTDQGKVLPGTTSEMLGKLTSHGYLLRFTLSHIIEKFRNWKRQTASNPIIVRFSI